MKYLILGLIFLAIYGLGYYFPKTYSECFKKEYGEECISWPLSIITALAIVAWLIFFETNAFWFWFLLIVAIICVVLSILYAIGTSKQVGATVLQTVLAVLAQLLSITGIVILVIIIIGAIMNSGKRRKK